jgi:peptidyl-prolyl cis-trans isomerase D
MLQAIRDRATGWIAYGIIGFLVIPFAFWGIDQYQGGGRINVAEVNGNDITLQEFQRAYQEQQARLSSLLGGQLDPALLDENRLKRTTLNQLVDERLMSVVAMEEGYRVGDRQLGSIVRELQAFRTDGRFDNERYEQLLRRQGLTPPEFEERMRVDLSTQQMQTGVQSTFAVTREELDELIKLVDQSRELGYLRFSLEAFAADLTIDEAGLEAWYAENKDRFRAPERAKVLYVELDAEQMAKEMPVRDEELAAYYEDQKSRYTRDEERRASHVLAQVGADAGAEEVAAARSRIEEMLAELRAGSLSFDEAMAQAADDPQGMLEAGDLGVVAPGMMDPAIEKALFELGQPGEVTELVRSEFGFHLIRLDDVEEGSQVPLAEVEDELRAELQRQRAESEFFELADELANVAYENPGSLDPVSEAIGVAVVESDWITPLGGDGIAAEPAFRAVVFSEEVLKEGVNSEPVELSATRLVVLRLLDHEQARVRDLAEVRDEVEQMFRTEKARAEIVAAAGESLDAAKAGQALAGMAEGDRVQWVAPVSVTRQEGSAPLAVIGEGFRLPRPRAGGDPSYGSVELESGDQAVIELVSVQDGDPASVSDETRVRLTAQLRQRYGAEQWQSSVSSLRSRNDIKLYPEQL